VQKDYASLDMAIAHISSLDPKHQYRVIFDGDIHKGYAAMLASYRAVRTFNYYINPAPIAQAVDFSYDYSPYYRYQGAAYLICRHCDTDKYGAFTYLTEFGDYKIYYDSEAYPRIFFGTIAGTYASTKDHTANTKDFIARVTTDHAEGPRKVYLEDSVRHLCHLWKPASSNVECKGSILYSSPIRYDLLAACEPGKILVLNEYYDGNWVGYINGTKVDVLKVNANQNGILLTGNTQFVRFEYRPALFYNLVYVSATTFLGVFLFAMYTCFRRFERRNKAASSPPIGQD
jgi:hypothetical protein